MSNTNATKTILTNLLVSLPFPFILLLALRTTAEFPVVEKLNATPIEGAVMFLESGYGVIFYMVTWLMFAIAGTLSTLFSLTSPAKNVSGSNVASSRQSKKSSSGSAGQGSETGTVKWFNVNKGFGFITTDAGEDVFVHFRSIQGRGRRSLRQGQSVSFDLTDGEKGLQAENVSVVK